MNREARRNRCRRRRQALTPRGQPRGWLALVERGIARFVRPRRARRGGLPPRGSAVSTSSPGATSTTRRRAVPSSMPTRSPPCGRPPGSMSPSAPRRSRVARERSLETDTASSGEPAAMPSSRARHGKASGWGIDRATRWSKFGTACPFSRPLWYRGPSIVFLHHVHAEMWGMVLPPTLARSGTLSSAGSRRRSIAQPDRHAVGVVTPRDHRDVGPARGQISVAPPGVDPRFCAGGRRSPRRWWWPSAVSCR